MVKSIPILALAISVLSASALAADSTPAVKEEVISAFDTIAVQADGRFVSEWETKRRLLDASGRDKLATKTFRFNDQLSTLDVIEAETIKADGRRIQVQPDQIRLQEDPAATGMPVFSTSKQKSIIFPDIEVGDTIHYRVRKTQTESDFPGNFTYSDSFNPDERVLDYKLVLKAPQSLNLRSEVSAMKEVRETDANGDKLWSWTFAQPDVRSFDDGKTDVFMNSPHVTVTTFANWEAIAHAYQARANDKVAVTPDIQTLADNLTRGVSDQREQTRILYNWVRTNVRYVALYLAQGGYVPHAAGDILRNRYGDCKDHVVLLEALLKAKGIDSHGVLIASGKLYKLTPEAIPDYFDHIISYVPALDLYLDSTAQYLPFGGQAYWLAGKSVLHVDASTGTRTTPAMTATDNKMSTSLTVSIGLDGSINGKLNELSHGGIAFDRRSVVAGVDPLRRSDVIKQLLARNGLNGKGEFTAGNPSSDDIGYPVDIGFSVEQTGLDLANPEALPIEMPMALGYSIADMTSFANDATEPHYGTGCAASDLTETYDITLPKEVAVQFLPKDLSVDDGPIQYRSTYKKDGQNIRVNRHYIMSIDKGYCSPDEVEHMKKAAIIIRQDLQRKVMLAPLSN